MNEKRLPVDNAKKCTALYGSLFFYVADLYFPGDVPNFFSNST